MAQRRDSRGRFAGGGGGGGGKSGGGSKSATSRATNTARAGALRAAGTTGIGGRVQAKGFSGGKAAQERAGGLRRKSGAGGDALKSAPRAGTVSRKGSVSAERAARKAPAKPAESTAAKPQKMSKAPANAAKARYKELSGTARKASPFRTAAENRQAAGAKRSLAAMERNRGTKGRTPKAVKAVAKAAAATYVAGQAARAALTGGRRRRK
jgi:hypothetical protein